MLMVILMEIMKVIQNVIMTDLTKVIVKPTGFPMVIMKDSVIG
jgi:hypothetical protein